MFGLDEMAVGLTNEDVRHVAWVMMAATSATPDIARKGVGPIADFLLGEFHPENPCLFHR